MTVADDTLPVQVNEHPSMSRLERECAAAATRWDAVINGEAENPRALSRGEFIAAHLASHFEFTPHREEQSS